jgi:hypothetical protein
LQTRLAATAAAAAGNVGKGSNKLVHGAVTSSSPLPLPMEEYGQYYGLIVYETRLEGPAAAAGGLLDFTGGCAQRATWQWCTSSGLLLCVAGVERRLSVGPLGPGQAGLL